jgi:protein required for attachment to host cells
MHKRPRQVLIADATRARMFHVQHGTLVPTPVWELATEIESSGDIASDRPGRGRDEGGEGRHQKGPSTDPHRYQKTRFAHGLAQRVERDRVHHRLDSLLIVAPPRTLGDLRRELSGAARTIVHSEIPKDLAHLGPGEIGAHLGAVLRA